MGISSLGGDHSSAPGPQGGVPHHVSQVTAMEVDTEPRMFQIGEHTIKVHQQPKASGSLRHTPAAETLNAVELPERSPPGNPAGEYLWCGCV